MRGPGGFKPYNIKKARANPSKSRRIAAPTSTVIADGRKVCDACIEKEEINEKKRVDPSFKAKVRCKHTHGADGSICRARQYPKDRRTVGQKRVGGALLVRPLAFACPAIASVMPDRLSRARSLTRSLIAKCRWVDTKKPTEHEDSR